jgi:cytidine deaminase
MTERTGQESGRGAGGERHPAADDRAESARPDGGSGEGAGADDAGGGGGDVASLIDRARRATERAHVPYSEYPVGAAIRTADGTVYAGCNVENANYSNTLHAEEVAIGAAAADGHREFDAIAVSSAARDGVTPCGMCRQTLAEFCDADLPVHCDEGDAVTTYALGELLPDTISLETLTAAASQDDAGDDPETPDRVPESETSRDGSDS